MTRNEFIESITDWWELKEFCSDNDCCVCEDVISEDEYDDNVSDDISDEVRNYGWTEIRDFLYDLPSGYDYYRINGTFNYDGLNQNDFEDYKEDVLEWGDDCGIWDEEEPEGEDDNEDTDESDWFSAEHEQVDDTEPPIEDEDFSVGDLMTMCSAVFIRAQQTEAEEQHRADEKFAQLLSLDKMHG